MNQEPKTALLRFRDLVAWQPNLTKEQLLKWERSGMIRVVQDGPRCHKFYFTKELVEILGIKHH